jgi:hypothetical protein
MRETNVSKGLGSRNLPLESVFSIASQIVGQKVSKSKVRVSGDSSLI